MTRKGFRTRIRSALAKTAGRMVNATIRGTTSRAIAAANHGEFPGPRTMASPHSHATSASSRTPVTTAMGER